MPKLPPPKSTDRITVAGLPDRGKTVFARFLAFQAMPDVFIYDPLDQYGAFPDDKRYVPETDSMAEFESVCARLCATPNTLFIVEEAERYFRQGAALGPYAFQLVNRGRNWGVGIVAVTRRIQELSKTFFDLCSHAYLFQCGIQSRRYLSEMIGRHLAYKVERLPPYYFLHYYVGAQEGEVGTLELPTPQARELVLGGEHE